MDRFNYNNPQNSNKLSPEEATTEKVETIEKLFGSFDEPDKSDSLLSELNEFETTGPFYIPNKPEKSESDNKPTTNIDELDLDGLKALRAEIARIQAEQAKEQKEEENISNGQEREKTKKLTTNHYKEGIHYDGFSEGSMAENFFRCAVLGFVTLSISGGWFFYIMGHIL
ncbi:MAG TPA: hypothetical protein IAB27_04430 [Candidatus Coprosoma intestinipullorum]|uniref:Uncharacterized protein n=1 Tax=Candidatus Coprosoma intestinipullorum TaxID=2840752 RepID=A0A9D0ZST0_9FIRM|nr:hypothetical protein [Candidatus Coprosoma intestinipullorum]